MLTKNIAKFWGYYQSLSYSDKSLKALKSRLGEVNDYVNRSGVRAISEIKYSHLLEFVIGDEATSAHVSKSRVWSLRRFFQYLVLQGILPNNPAADLSYPKLEKQVPQFLSAGEFERILDLLSERILEGDGLWQRHSFGAQPASVFVPGGSGLAHFHHSAIEYCRCGCGFGTVVGE